MMFPTRIEGLAQKAIAALIADGKIAVTAESCTGGLISGALTEISGSSAAVYGGFVTYANEAKMAMIGVPAETLAAHGAVSEEIARAMVAGALAASGADVAVAVTGIAGPTGGSAEKPVGLVHLACATTDTTLHRRQLYGDLGRTGIRSATIVTALEMMLEILGADQL